MRTVRIIASALRALRGHHVRTGFMVLATCVGVGALTLLVALGKDTEREVIGRANRMLGAASIIVRAGASRAVGGAPTTTRTLTLNDLAAIRDRVPAVQVADPFIMTSPRTVTYESTDRSVRLVGQSHEADRAWDRPVTRGDHISEADVASAARVAMVGEVVVATLFGGRDPVGESIRIDGMPFRVIGVVARVGPDPHGVDRDDEIIVPITTLMRRVLNIDFIAGGKLQLRSDADPDRTTLEVQDVLRERHALGPDDADDFALFSSVQVRQRIAESTRVFTLFLPAASLVAVLVAMTVIANLMLMTVNARRAEIGLRKALGARPADIRTQFLVEAVAVTVFGGVLAIAAAWIVLRVQRPGATMPLSTALLGVAVAIAVGVVAGVWPARRAAQLDPVSALRS